jgi:hypothetical protein
MLLPRAELEGCMEAKKNENKIFNQILAEMDGLETQSMSEILLLYKLP